MAKNEKTMDGRVRRFGELKAKAKDAILLFRCGDFYEAYYEDAKVVADVCDVTLTRENGNGGYMCGFPHHALDAYLPKLIRAGKRVAICDLLPDPPKKPAKRGITELVTNNSELTTKNSETMKPETSNMKPTMAADLIGKTIILGATGAKYVVNSVNGDKLECDFSNGKGTIPMSVPVSQAQKFLASGTWKIEGSLTPDLSPKGDGSKPVIGSAASPVEETKDMSIRTEADVAEVDDILPVVTPKASGLTPDPSPKGEGSAKPKVKVKSETKPQTSAVSPQTSKGKLTYSTYDVKKVDKKTKKEYTVTRAKISGMATDDAAYVNAVSLHASASYEVVDGKKVYILAFSHRYAAAAKDVCAALNAGKSLEDCQAIIAKATEERAAKIEAHKAKREERKARKSEELRVKSEEFAAAQTSAEKTYTQAELAEWLRKLNAGTDKEKAEAAKFFNDLAKAA